MKIGIDARCLEWQRGGVSRYLVNMLKLWPSMTTQHRFVLYFQNAIPDDDFLKNPMFEKRLIAGPELLRRKRIVCEQLLLPKAVAADAPDLFFATWYSAPLLLRGPKVVVAAWDISYSTHPEHYSLLNRFSLGFFSKRSTVAADGTITCSDFDARQIENYYGIPKEKICTLYLAADDKFSPEKNPASFERLKARYNIKGRYLLSMGVIYNRRNVDVIVEAFKRIKDEFPDVSLVVVGKNHTSPHVDIQGALAPLEAEGRAAYHDWIPEEDVLDLYRWAHHYICTSTVDGETIMLKEAMKCGTPVIASELLRETIGGIGHIIADPTRVDETAQVLRTALGTPDGVRNELIARGIDWVQQFSWEKVARKSLEFLESRVQAPSPHPLLNGVQRGNRTVEAR